MPDIRRVTNIEGAGTLAYYFVPKIVAACDAMHATPSLSTVGVAEFNRAVNNQPLRLARPGVVDVSPAPKEIRTAIGYAGDDLFAETNRATWERLSYQMVDKVVRVTGQRRLTGSQTLWVQGLKTGHGKPAQEMLERQHERLPDGFVVVKSTLPDDADQRPKAVVGYDLFHDLHARKVVTVTILGDNSAPFAQTFKLSEQDKFEARALAALLAAQPQFGKNKSLAEIGRSLGEHSPFAGWAFCSRSLEPVKDGLGWSLLRGLRPSLPRRGQAHIAHVAHEARIATERALTEPTARAIDEEIDLSKPLFLIFIVPLPLGERQGWEAFSNELRRWLAVTYPNAVPIFCAGEGTPDPRYSGSYWLQVSALFPLPPIPRPIHAYIPPTTTAQIPESVESAASSRDLPRVVPLNGAVAAPRDYVPGQDGVA